MRVHLETKKHCYNHPHRDTVLACERCRISYCPDCLAEYDGSKLCATCIRELADAKAAIPTTRERLADFGRRLKVTAIVLVVVGLISAGLFQVYRGSFERPLTPEELARFRYAMSGTFQTPEGINVTSTVLGAAIASETSQDPAHPAKSLINEYTGPGAPAWRSTSATFPQNVVISLDQVSSVEKVIFTNNPSEPTDTYPKEVEVLVSNQGPDKGFTSVGSYQLAQTTDPQKFTFPTVQASWIELRILSNYGSTAYTSLDEFNAFNVPDSSIVQPSPNGGANPAAGTGAPSP